MIRDLYNYNSVVKDNLEAETDLFLNFVKVYQSCTDVTLEPSTVYTVSV